MKSKIISIIEKKFNYRSFQKYFSNTAWLFFERIFRLVVVFFLSIWTARLLKPNGYGLLSYAESLTEIFFVISAVGLNSILIREIIKFRELKSFLLFNSLFLRIISSLITFLTLNFCVFAFSKASKIEKLVIFIVSTKILFSISDVFDSYFQAHVKAKFSVISRSISFFVSSILKLFFLIKKLSVVYFSIAIAIENFLSLIFLFMFFVRKKNFKLISKVDFAIIKKLLKDSWPLMFSSFSVIIYSRIDQIMLKSMLSNSEVGKYAVAVKVSSIWNFIPAVISASVFPLLVQLKEADPFLYRKRLQLLLDIVTFSAIAFSFFITIFSKEIILSLFGPEYLESAKILLIYVWTCVFVSSGAAAARFVIIDNLTLNALYRTLSGAILNIVLNFILIKKFGSNGAALSTLIAAVFVNFLSMAITEPTRKCFYLQARAFNIFRIFSYMKEIKIILR